MSEDSNSSKEAVKRLTEKQLLKLVRNSWEAGKPISAEAQAILVAVAPDLYQNNILLSVAGFALNFPDPPSAEAAKALVQRDAVIRSAQAEIDSILQKVQPAALNPGSPSYKKEFNTEKKNLLAWKKFFVNHRALFPLYPSLQKSEDCVNEALRSLNLLSEKPKKPVAASAETRGPDPQLIAKKFAEGLPVAFNELLPSIYKGKPAHVILEAAATLLGAEVKNPSDETTRNLMAAGALENLSVDSAREALAKRNASGVSQKRFPRFLNRLSRNTPELRSFVIDLQAAQALSKPPVTADKVGATARAEAPSKKEEDPLAPVRSAWEKGEPVSDSEESRLCEFVSKPGNRKLLMGIARIMASGASEDQQERIIAAGKNAVIAICSDAIRDAHEYAHADSKEKKKDAKARLKLAHRALWDILALGHEFPEIKSAFESVMVSIEPPLTSNGKIELVSSLIEQGKDIEVLDSMARTPGIVTGIFARDRIGQLLNSNKMTSETADWAVDYLGDCIRRADGEKRAKAVSLLLQESATVPLARQRAIEEAASITSRLPHKDQREISEMLHKFSRKAKFSSPGKTLFMDFAQEARKYEEVDPKLFPLTPEERQTAGGGFKKYSSENASGQQATTLIPAVTARLPPADEALLAEALAPQKPAEETNPLVKLDKTLLLTPQTLAKKFAMGEDVVPEELDPSIFSGQPSHRILNAANVLLEAKIPQIENGGAATPNTRLVLARNHIVASLLSELPEEDLLPVLEKRQGGKLPDGIAPSTVFNSILMNMHNDTEALRTITRELLYVSSSPAAPASASVAAPEPAPAATIAAPEPALPAPVEPEQVPAPQPAPAPAPEFPSEPSVSELIRGIAREAEASMGPDTGAFPPKSILSAMHALSEGKTPKQRKAAYDRIALYFAEGSAGEYTQIDLIRDISECLSTPAKDDVALLAGSTVAEALISLPSVAKWGPVESQEMRMLLAFANPDYVTPAVLSRIHKGSEAEKGEALLILLERAGANGKVFEDGKSLYELALVELIEMGPEQAVPALFSLAGSNCPEALLTEFLTAYEPEISGKEAIGIILAKRSANPGALFPSEETEEEPSDEKAMEAIEVLQFYGGATRLTHDYEEEKVAKGAAQVMDASAIRFLIQGMNDSEETTGIQIWKNGLRELSAQNAGLAVQAEALLISSFDRLGEGAKGAAFELLSERPSVKQAEFLLSLAITQGGAFSEKAEAALSDYDFSSFDSAEAFTVMAWMYNAGVPAGVGAERLRSFLASHRANPEEWLDPVFLSYVFTDSQDRALAIEARDSLVSSSEKMLASSTGISGLDKVLGAISSRESEDVSELAAYSLAAEMRRQGGKFSADFHKKLFNAARSFKKDGDDAAIHLIMIAAQAAATDEAMRQVLIPSLISERQFPELSAKALLSTEDGALQLALAASMENHPEGINQKGAKKLSEKALSVLSSADTEISARALVFLLKNKKNDLCLSAYDALEKAGDSKCPVLLELLSSGDTWEKYAAIKLLPVRADFVRNTLPLAVDKDASVSGAALEYVVSASGSEGVASLLSSPDVSDEMQQKLGVYCAMKNPEMLEAILSQAQGEGKTAEDALNSLGFLPVGLSLPVLLSVLESGKETSATARKNLVQIVWLLSGEKEESSAETAAYNLVELYLRTSDSEVRDAIVDASRGPFAGFIVEDAISSGEPAHSLAALEIFLQTENSDYAVEVSQRLRASFFPSHEEAEFLAPLYQVLFGNEFDKMAHIKPGTPEYALLQEVAEQEFIYGDGSRESRELLFSFMKRFGSRQVRESLLEKGPLAVSEFLWSMRGDKSEESAVRWLRSMKDAQVNSLLGILVDCNYPALGRTMEDTELSEAIGAHAMRRALLSFAELSRVDATPVSDRKAIEGLELYSQLLARDASIGLPSERADFNAVSKSLGLQGMVNEGGIRKGEQLIRSICSQIMDFDPLRHSARLEARKLARKSDPPSGQKPLVRVRRITENPK